MKSLWKDSCEIKYQKTLSDFDYAEVLVVGAGMAGILTAYELQKRGMNVKVLEANKIACGVTQNTTAKITSQHNLIYNNIIQSFGTDKAKQYSIANEHAITKYEEIIKENNISCSYGKQPAYVYTTDDEAKIENEMEACEKLGLNAEYTTKSTLPFPIKAAIRFDNQAEFHPLEFINGIIPALDIYENTIVRSIEDNKVFTDGKTITVKHIVMAAHYPFINVPGYYFMRMHQERSYVIALENVPKVDGMYISSDQIGYSFRNYNDYLILGGGKHRTGKNKEGGRYDELRKLAKEYYNDFIESYHWSAQDCMTIDGIPYIGRFSESTPNLYVATGFNKWGMSSSMAAAEIIADLITETDNEYSEVFSPSRFNVNASMKKLIINGAESIKGLILKKLTIPAGQLEHINIGQSDIIQYEGEKIGVYKDSEGEIFLVSVKCTHLGCQLEWNPDELSWDCPCHGSRFDYKGNVINTPALENLTDA